MHPGEYYHKVKELSVGYINDFKNEVSSSFMPTWVT